MREKRKRVIHTIRSAKLRKALTLAVAADLHNAPWDDVMDDFLRCDAVLLPGDLVNRHRDNDVTAARFLREVPERIPVFYSVGNHERKNPRREEWFRLVEKSSIRLLDIRIGGLSSVAGGVPDTAFLDRFEREEGFRLLMCHHPEMYRDHVAGRDIDFTVCGHAHGGQVRFFGQGLYAPGQGFFPKLTRGLYDGGRMIVSAGMTNGTRMPRINNPRELIILKLEPGEKEEGT